MCSIVSFVEKSEKCLENLVKVGAHCMYLFSFFTHLLKLAINKKQKSGCRAWKILSKATNKKHIYYLLVFEFLFKSSSFSNLNAAALLSSSFFISWPWCTCSIRKKINKNNKIVRASEIKEPIVNVLLHLLIVRLLVG